MQVIGFSESRARSSFTMINHTIISRTTVLLTAKDWHPIAGYY